jgi:hypothetical protein
MDDGNRQGLGWSAAWRLHRQEVGLWAAILAFYLLFMRDAESSRYTFVFLSGIYLLPPVIAGRMIWSAKIRKSDTD